MARTSKRFCLIVLLLDNCQLIARYERFLWCYSQNSRLIGKIGKKRIQIPFATHQLWTKRISYPILYIRDYTLNKYHLVLVVICGVILKIVGSCPKYAKSA